MKNWQDLDAVTRRSFLQSSVAGTVAATSCFSQCQLLYGEDANLGADNAPCIDYPIREDDGASLSSIDLAIIEQNPDLASLITGGNTRSAARALEAAYENVDVSRAPTRGGEPAQPPARLAARNQWDVGSKLRVRFNGGTSALRKRVREIADEWTKYANIDFEGSTSADSEIRVDFTRTGHWSYVGKDSLGVGGQTMNLELNDSTIERPYNMGVVLHEFGHALGAIHEHQQPDADGLFDELKTINYFQSRYGWPAAKTRRNVLNRYDKSKLTVFSKFDRSSIMLYAYPGSITKSGAGTPTNTKLSPTDIEFMCKLYPGRHDCSSDGNSGDGDQSGDDGDVAALERELAVGATAPLSGKISANAATNLYRVTISEAGTYTVSTQGYTQVVVSKFTDTSGKAVDLEGKRFTQDLVNQSIKPVLAVGEYKIEVSHKHAGGGGEYRIQIQKGDR